MSSTDRPSQSREAGMQPWHFYLLLAMVAATVAVFRSTDTQPAALLLLSAAVIAAGVVAIASHYALAGFLGADRKPVVLSDGIRQELEQEKALVLRSIKELEFDHSMRKMNDADFAEVGARLRARAMALIEELDRPAPASLRVVASSPRAEGSCPACQTANDSDARFCKSCGTKL